MCFLSIPGDMGENDAVIELKFMKAHRKGYAKLCLDSCFDSTSGKRIREGLISLICSR